MNFSGIPRTSLLGRGLRLLLQIIPPNAVVPILQGALKGRKWIVGSSVHGCWLGSYEFEKQRAITQCVRGGDVFYDVGANVGFYTMLAAELVQDTGQVYAFEPLPRNVSYLRRHVEMNCYANVRIYPLAVADREGRMNFSEGSNPSMARIDPSGAMEVSVTSLDILVDKEQLRLPSVLKIDVEGAEYDVLRGAARLLGTCSPLIFLASHGRETHHLCTGYLSDLGYHVRPLGAVSLEQADELFAYRPD